MFFPFYVSIYASKKRTKIVDINAALQYICINNIAEQQRTLKMIKGLFKKMFTRRSEQDRLYNYLCQATDRVHLEVLQREWDRMSYRDRSMW